MSNLTIFDFIFPTKIKKSEPKRKKSFRVSWKELDLETLQLFHESAIERVKDTVNDHHEISKRYFGLLILVISVSTAICSFLFNENPFHLKIIASAAVVLSLIILLIIGQMLRPIKFRAIGRNPYQAISPKLFQNNKFTASETLKVVLYTELLNYQATIDLNQFYNTVRLEAIDLIIRLMFIGILTISILLIIVLVST